LKKISQIIWEHVNQRPYGTESFACIDQIIIPKRFLNSIPSDSKVKKYYKRYFRYQYLDRPIIIRTKYYNGNYHMILQDGYIRLLIMWNIINTYMDTYNVKFEEVPVQLKYVPIKYMEG